MRKLGFALMLALLFTTSARADLQGPSEDFTITTPNGANIFVMIYKYRNDNYSQAGIKPNKNLRQTYPTSGLYSASDPSQMLYSVDWNATNVILSNDGEYLIRWGPWPWHHQYNEIAVEFYHNGRLLEGYLVSDLSQQYSKFRNSASHYQWLRKYSFDQQTNLLTVNLFSGERYVFNATTGKVIEPTGFESPSAVTKKQQRTLKNLALSFIVLALPSAAWIFWRKRKAA